MAAQQKNVTKAQYAGIMGGGLTGVSAVGMFCSSGVGGLHPIKNPLCEKVFLDMGIAAFAASMIAAALLYMAYKCANSTKPIDNVNEKSDQDNKKALLDNFLQGFGIAAGLILAVCGGFAAGIAVAPYLGGSYSGD